MSFREIIEAAQAMALSDKLYPDELAIWHKYCREYSKLFYEPLSLVIKMDPEWVMYQVYSNQLSTWNNEENLEDIQDLLGTLSDPDYDVKKERTHREQMQKILDEERLRVVEGRAIHKSLEKNDLVIKAEEPVIKKELPKSGGINMDLIRSLQNEEKETGDF